MSEPIEKGVISGMARGTWQDARLRPLDDAAECFLCGKRIVNVAHAGKLEMGGDGSGDFMGTLPMNMHLRCIDGLEVVDLLVRYRKALAAALRGTKEDA